MLKKLFARLFSTQPKAESWKRFSKVTRDVLNYGQMQAEAFRHAEIEPEHVFVGLAAKESGIVSKVLGEAGISKEQAFTYIKEHPNQFVLQPNSTGKISLSNRTKKMLENTVANARRYSRESICTGDILIAILEDPEIKPLIKYLKGDEKELRYKIQELLLDKPATE